MSHDNPDRILLDTHYYLRIGVRRVDNEDEAVEVIESAGGNKDEGIGVGGWTIRRDHPMKPSAVQGIVDIPYHGEVLLEMTGGESELEYPWDREEMDERKEDRGEAANE